MFLNLENNATFPELFRLKDGDYTIVIKEDRSIVLSKVTALSETHTFTNLKEMHEKLQSKAIWMKLFLDEIEKLQGKEDSLAHSVRLEKLRNLIQKM